VVATVSEPVPARADEFLRSAQHPTLGCGYLECAYAPMAISPGSGDGSAGHSAHNRAAIVEEARRAGAGKDAGMTRST
jgi:hypothetical protein